MTEYEFLLKFTLPQTQPDPLHYVDALFESGCDDATIGTGQYGRLALAFTRQASSARAAISSAIDDVLHAIPEAKLIEANPDFVGLTDIAAIMGCSRQNIRKVATHQKSIFPLPIHEGSTSIWHLAKVLEWFQQGGNYEIPHELIEISHETMKINITRQLNEAEQPTIRNH